MVKVDWKAKGAGIEQAKRLFQKFLAGLAAVSDDDVDAVHLRPPVHRLAALMIEYRAAHTVLCALDRFVEESFEKSESSSSSAFIGPSQHSGLRADLASRSAS